MWKLISRPRKPNTNKCRGVILPPKKIDPYYEKMLAAYRERLTEQAAEIKRMDGTLSNAVQKCDVYEKLEENNWDVRHVGFKTGGDDYAIHWVVIEHRMTYPFFREVGVGGKTPIEAIAAALDAAEKAGE